MDLSDGASRSDALEAHLENVGDPQPDTGGAVDFDEGDDRTAARRVGNGIDPPIDDAAAALFEAVADHDTGRVGHTFDGDDWYRRADGLSDGIFIQHDDPHGLALPKTSRSQQASSIALIGDGADSTYDGRVNSNRYIPGLIGRRNTD